MIPAASPPAAGDPHAREAGHPASTGRDATDEVRLRSDLELTMLRAMVPDPRTRRAFLRAVGLGPALAAISSVLPGGALDALAQGDGALEKRDLRVGFLPITCATPIIFAHAAGFYAKEGLNVTIERTAGWALVRDRLLAGEFDVSQMLSPMPLAITAGLGSAATPMVMPALVNLNGNAITLSMKHRDRRDPKTWKGMRFGIPFEFSMHNFLLRAYLAEHGLDPERDVQLRVLAPPDMVANLKAGNIDGFIVAEPFNQRAVFEGLGFIHLLTSELWDGHPCCAYSFTARFAKQHPNTFAAVVRAVMKATRFANNPDNRRSIAEMIHGPTYLNQPLTVVEQVLTGRYADGLGNVREVPGRISFEPFPWQSMAVWMLSQMERWGYLKPGANIKALAEQVFLATDARKRMAELGMDAPRANFRRHTILGRPFDAAPGAAKG